MEERKWKPSRDSTQMMENEMEKRVGNEMDTRVI